MLNTVKVITKEQLKPNTLGVYDILDSYNMAATLMEVEPVTLKIMQMANSQAILGKTFKINVYDDNRISIIINQEDKYDAVMETEEKIKALVDDYYELEIDGRTNPVKAKFRIDLPDLANGKAFVGRLMDIIEIK